MRMKSNCSGDISLKERVSRCNFAYAYLQKQLVAARNFAEMLSTNGNSNFDQLNKLMGQLTIEITEKNQELAQLKAENERLQQRAISDQNGGIINSSA